MWSGRQDAAGYGRQDARRYNLSLNVTPVRLSKLHKFMTLSLGKLLYPNLQPDQRQREMHVLLTTLLTGLITAGIIVLVMIVMGKK
jgi:hypothetical protein